MSLPSFPVDDTILDLLDIALNPVPGTERSSLTELLDLLSSMGGSDITAIESEYDNVIVMRDPTYHYGDVINALIAEVKRLRSVST